MENQQPRQATTSTDRSRLVATTPDGEFTLSIDEALQRYSEAGLPRTPRSIQRYCALGHLEARRIDTQFGQKWLITPASVDRHIAYIKEVTPPTGRDLARPVATGDDTQHEGISEKKPGSDEPRQAATSTDRSRPVATSGDSNGGRIVEFLERENAFLREQVGVKDSQIKDLTERARETNVLINGLQKMLSPLLGRGDSHPRPSDDHSAQ